MLLSDLTYDELLRLHKTLELVQSLSSSRSEVGKAIAEVSFEIIQKDIKLVKACFSDLMTKEIERDIEGLP